MAERTLCVIHSCRRAVNGEGARGAGDGLVNLPWIRSHNPAGGILSGTQTLVEATPGRASTAEIKGSNPLTDPIQNQVSRKNNSLFPAIFPIFRRRFNRFPNRSKQFCSDRRKQCNLGAFRRNNQSRFRLDFWRRGKGFDTVRESPCQQFRANCNCICSLKNKMILLYNLFKYGLCFFSDHTASLMLCECLRQRA